MVQVDPTQLSNQECLVSNTTANNSTVEFTAEKRFNWTSEQQGLVLGSFFYGYCVTQVAGGWFADKYSFGSYTIRCLISLQVAEP